MNKMMGNIMETNQFDIHPEYNPAFANAQSFVDFAINSSVDGVLDGLIDGTVHVSPIKSSKGSPSKSSLAKHVDTNSANRESRSTEIEHTPISIKDVPMQVDAKITSPEHSKTRHDKTKRDKKLANATEKGRL